MSLVWPRHDLKGALHTLELKPGQVSIGRDPKSPKNELIIIDEISRKTYRMGRYNSYVSRIDLKEGKYGSIIIRCNNDRSIEIARAPRGANPVEVVPSFDVLPEGKETYIVRPFLLKKEGERIKLGKGVYAIYIPSRDIEEIDPLIAYLFVG